MDIHQSVGTHGSELLVDLVIDGQAMETHGSDQEQFDDIVIDGESLGGNMSDQKPMGCGTEMDGRESKFMADLDSSELRGAEEFGNVGVQFRVGEEEMELESAEFMAGEGMLESLGIRGLDVAAHGENYTESRGRAERKDKLRKMHILSAIAATLTTLTVALASVSQLLMNLPGLGLGLSSTGVTGSSSAAYSAVFRGSSWSSFMYSNLRVFLFLRLIHMRMCTPRQLQSVSNIKPHTVEWFAFFIDFAPREDPEKFKEYFRISPDLFYHVCEMVSDEMLTNPPKSLRGLPNRLLIVERQVAIAIRRLATGNLFVTIADSFKVSKSTAVKVTWKFIQAFNTKAHGHLQWPQGDKLHEVKEGFRSKWGFPNCCGVVDGTHFTVEFPKSEDTAAYLDFNQTHSVSMQAIVDHEQRFMDVVAGWPGSVQDTHLMHKSNFFKSVVYSKTRLQGPMYVCQDGTRLREYILGDEEYPLHDWLIVPYPRGESEMKDEWNRRQENARSSVERAFSRLKGTWRILSRILWKPRKERIGPMIYTCCLLHNMIINRQDGLSPDVYADVNPHFGGYGSISLPTRAAFDGGPAVRNLLYNEVMRPPSEQNGYVY